LNLALALSNTAGRSTLRASMSFVSAGDGPGDAVGLLRLLVLHLGLRGGDGRGALASACDRKEDTESEQRVDKAHRSSPE